ncbi:DUF2461 domain-containing protein [Nakamurella aerolata]|uniref:DUF2461 domain-containing protein n=1 Tax=Nakamurella aerolata TaxID=1656892 RepID=A0A849AEV6_9ACTN|nr:DUF2461 domain-containing protein [Nakamurella aerolata]NNG35382.1 DUF2461 domain-containing protein [Nakamurella aerolata]
MSPRKSATPPVAGRRSDSGRAGAAAPGSSRSGTSNAPSDFAGIPEEALDFYDDLEQDNSKAFWEARREQYQRAVRDPMERLAIALQDEFGTTKLFRPYRDVRFAKDKTPYKTHQGLFVAVGPATGWYAEVSARGFRVGAGFYHAEPAWLAAIREGIAGPDGAELQRLLRLRERQGWTVSGDAVKTTPRGYSAEHPRIELLRYKSIFLGRGYGFDPVLHTGELVDRVRADWRAGRPLIDWIEAHTAGLQ